MIGFGLGWIFTLIFWGLIIWGILTLVRGARSGKYHYGGHEPWGHWGSQREDALEILKNRYAKGEITKEEFERMKKDLM